MWNSEVLYTLKDVQFIEKWKFQSSQIYEPMSIF